MRSLDPDKRLIDKITSLSELLRNAKEEYRLRGHDDTAKTNEYIVALQTELEILSQEFDKKFSETIQFKNLERMLEGKTSQIR